MNPDTIKNTGQLLHFLTTTENVVLSPRTRDNGI
jgi:hypothetical protein